MVVQFICCVGGVFTRAGLDGAATPSSLPHISFSSRTFYPTILQIASPILLPFHTMVERRRPLFYAGGGVFVKFQRLPFCGMYSLFEI